MVKDSGGSREGEDELIGFEQRGCAPKGTRRPERTEGASQPAREDETKHAE